MNTHYMGMEAQSLQKDNTCWTANAMPHDHSHKQNTQVHKPRALTTNSKHTLASY